ncbi:MAG: hypothetical protein KIS62_01395 [Ramlibacter sp.]|nr:hypothetical protein [Ramlibacter sp.]
MNIIALTGHPVAQEAAHLQLQSLIAQRGLGIRVLSGVTSADEATAVYAEGGELWQCGSDEPRPELVNHIDRTLPADNFDTMALHVAGALAGLLAKASIDSGSARHGR